MSFGNLNIFNRESKGMNPPGMRRFNPVGRLNRL